MNKGDLEFWRPDGTFRLDGGAMFGVIPKPMWEKVAPPDARNRILMAMNSLLIRAAEDLVERRRQMGRRRARTFMDLKGCPGCLISS